MSACTPCWRAPTLSMPPNDGRKLLLNSSVCRMAAEPRASEKKMLRELLPAVVKCPRRALAAADMVVSAGAGSFLAGGSLFVFSVSPDASAGGGGVCVGGVGLDEYWADATRARSTAERQTAARNATLRFIKSLPCIARYSSRRVGAAGVIPPLAPQIVGGSGGRRQNIVLV